MKNFVKKSYTSTKEFVVDHKVTLSFMAGAICVLALHVNIMKDHNNFLKEHGLYDKYYTTPTDW